MPLREFHDAGLLWLANRALHPFGYALMLQMLVDEETGERTVLEETGLRIVRTRDPRGFAFTDAQEDESRDRFFAWLKGRLS